MRHRWPRRRHRWRNAIVTSLVAAGLLVLNAGPRSPIGTAVRDIVHNYQTSQPEYMAQYGHWDMLDVPAEFKVNAIHAALLPTGKVLIVAGSGNDALNFRAGTFKTLLWDPATGAFKLIPTPADMFCGGHAFLPNGNLLIAGGTKRYEVLAADVKRAAGPMTIKNESPNGPPVTLPKGTRFTSLTGVTFSSTEDATVLPAVKMTHGGATMTHASQTEVWVEAVNEGQSSVINQPSQYRIDGLTGDAQRNLYGVADKLTMEKQEYQGINDSYEFNPFIEQYARVGNLTYPRWYPTLVSTEDGNVLAVSGLDQFGRILEGQNEVYAKGAKQWHDMPSLYRFFPTYPALFLMSDGRLFYSGSNSGYGSAEEGRTPGIWNLQNNTFDVVPGLRDPQMTETSASVLLPPAQDQKVMIMGGGGIGESSKATSRTDIVDLREVKPHYTPNTDLATPTRYLNAVILPDDTVLATGGSSDYRGKGDSDLHIARIYHPDTGAFQLAADSTVGRDYHSEALLLPDGRVITLGSNPLYADADNTTPATFEQRIEIYSPPYLYHGNRPVITGGPASVKRGTTVDFVTPDPAAIKTAKLMRPSAVTHVTDVEQRSIALDATRKTGTISLSIPTQPGLVPSGWYMLFVTDQNNVPSVARWVQVQ